MEIGGILGKIREKRGNKALFEEKKGISGNFWKWDLVSDSNGWRDF